MKSSVSYAVMSSICALIVGLLLILWPDVAVNYLVITIGVLFLLPGIYGLFSYFVQAKKRERANLHVSFPVIITLSSAVCKVSLQTLLTK